MNWIKLDITDAMGKDVDFRVAPEWNFTAWPDESQVIDFWLKFGTEKKCISEAKKAEATNQPKVYATLLHKAAEMAMEQLCQKMEYEFPIVVNTHKRFYDLTEQEQAFIRDFFGKIYGKRYVRSALDRKHGIAMVDVENKELYVRLDPPRGNK